jgi:hypothetical protein
MHKVKVTKSQALEFWQWFASNCNRLEHDLGDQEILHELDRRVLLFTDGSLSWEVGPGRRKPYGLVISPSGQKSMLQVTRSIVSAAPEIESWEFYYAKPPKDWSQRFSFRGVTGKDVFIDATHWEYVLMKFTDGTFDIVVRTVGCEGANQEDRLTAIGILLDGILGELTRLEKICSVEAVEDFDADLRGKASSVKVLRDHIESLGT